MGLNTDEVQSLIQAVVETPVGLSIAGCFLGQKRARRDLFATPEYSISTRGMLLQPTGISTSYNDIQQLALDPITSS